MKRYKFQYGAANALTNLVPLSDIPDYIFMQASNDDKTRQHGNKVQDEIIKRNIAREKLDFADKLEPIASGIGLIGDIIGFIPGGQPIALALNVPNMLIDSYQLVRDGYNLSQGQGNMKDIGLDLLELAGSSIGAKYISNANKARLSNKIDNKINELTEQAYQARKK